MKVNHSSKDSDGREEVHNVGKTITVEGFLESAGLVVPSEQKVEEGDDGTFKLGSTTSVDSVRRKGFPNDRFANVGSDEKRDTGTKTVTFGEQFIEEDDDERGRNELENKEKTDTRAQRGGRAVKTGQDVNGSLTKGNNHGKHYDSLVASLVRKRTKARTFLGSTEQGAVVLEAKVDINQLGTCEKLHDHARSDDGGDTKLHQGTPVGSEDSTKPVKRVGGVRGHDAVERNLRADEEDEEGDGCPGDLVVENDLQTRRLCEERVQIGWDG